MWMFLFTGWLACRADSSGHWAYQSIQRPQVPILHETGRVQTPIDRFILAQLQSKSLAMAPPADRRTLLRRMSYDLVGLPPTPEQIDAFENDRSPDAVAKVIDRLLASPAYGERWGRHWLDVVRYADARDLIQLPVESDFREAWRYRDWVVEAHNRDLPYAEFIRQQLAGDLMQPSNPEAIDTEALVATGFLAIADFVPGDVDKEQMIADYVNDQVDVMGRAFLGLTLGCARCHDHKFDPVTTRDYYALAGIFFSTRLIPSPVLGNTPLVRVPLVSRAELDRIEVRKKRRGEMENQIAELRRREELEYGTAVERLVAEQSGRYLKACWELYPRVKEMDAASRAVFARERDLHPQVLQRWLEVLDGNGGQASAKGTNDLGPQEWRSILAGAGWQEYWSLLTSPDRSELRRMEVSRVVEHIEQSLKATHARELASASSTPKDSRALVDMTARDPRILRNGEGRVRVWPNRARTSVRWGGLVPMISGPQCAEVVRNGVPMPVIRFTGNELLELRQAPPPSGSLFLVYRVESTNAGGQRMLGWEDSDGGRHGLGLMPTPGGGLHAILRKDGANGDIVAPPRIHEGFELVSVTWGPQGAALYRDGQLVGKNAGITGISADPAISALRLGGPGSGGASKFRGDLAELRIYDGVLDDSERQGIEAELVAHWVTAQSGIAGKLSSPNWDYEALGSPSGPFWLDDAERARLVSLETRPRRVALEEESRLLLASIPTNLPQAVVVQEGGPVGTRHEGFKDAPIYVRGNPAKLGDVVPRGFPKFLPGSDSPGISEGSGRRQLAEWIASPLNPLTARVAVNRIWQHHFGQGLVRTSTNFGQRGEPPTHPELLDYLASVFLENGGSMKALHRMILLSAVYQQESGGTPEAIAADPENRWLARMNRRSLDAEAFRDSLLAVSGRLDLARGGAGYLDMELPRRTLYLMSVRTGAKAGFASVFDAPDCTAVVERRSESTVAPQALFLMNDHFSLAQAQSVARRAVGEHAAADLSRRIQSVYRTILGRPPSVEEIEVARGVMGDGSLVEGTERLCHLLLCSNEFFYVD